MKLLSPHASRFTRHESGMAVIVVMILLSIVLIYVAANLRMLRSLGNDVRLIEQKQIRRWEQTNLTTNLTSAAPLPSAPTQPATNAPPK